MMSGFELFKLDLGTAQARRPSRYYVAYGSNLCIERMEGRCPYAEIIGTSVIPGYRLLFKKSQTGFYATIEQDANCQVPVVVYKISEYDETLLNRYEGFPKHYYKKYFQLPVTRLNGKRMKERKNCMAYVLHEDRLLGEPSMEYYSLLDAGYWDWNFDDAILEKALADSIGTKAALKYMKQYRKL